MSGSDRNHDPPDSAPISSSGVTAHGSFTEAFQRLANPVQYEADDPDPLPANANTAEKEAYREEVESYSKDMLEALQSSNITGEALWIEYTATFRRHTIEALPKHMAQRWVSFLITRGVHVTRKRFYPRVLALVECLLQEQFTPASANAQVDSHMTGSRIELKEEDTRRIDQSTTERTQEVENQNGIGGQEERSGLLHGELATPQRFQPSGHENNPNRNRRDREPLDNSMSKDLPRLNVDHGTVPHDNRRTPYGFKSPANQAFAYSNHQNDNSLGITGLMRAYQGREKFSGKCDEDLSSAFLLYETLSRVCHLTDQEKAEALPVMLKEEALAFHSRVYSPRDSFDDIRQKLLNFYTSDEQRNRLLCQWQTMKLSDAMRQEPDKSEAEVFRSFSFNLSALQKQLSSNYQHDSLLRDQLMIACDIDRIQQSLRERVPKTAQEAMNRISTYLSHQSKSAGSYLTENVEEDSALYSLGRRYGGEARRNFRPGGTYQRYGRQRRLSSKWIRGVKGCYVCGQDHKARSRHSREEVRAAIERLKQSHPSALISVEDMAYISEQLNESQETIEGPVEDVQFSDEDDYSYLSLDVRSLQKDTEVLLANSSFVHGRTFSTDLRVEMAAMFSALSMSEVPRFKGLLIDTCANRSSVMSYSQYRAYCEEFNVPMDIDTGTGRSVLGIGGTTKAIGTATIPIPFQHLDLVIEVKFQIVRNNVPTLLSMKDMLENGLDISIQDAVVKFKNAEQKLAVENYFLVHRWKPSDLSYSLYTETELRKLHRVFGHPSVQALYNLLKRANPDELNSTVRKHLEDIVRECQTCIQHSAKPRRFKVTIGTDDLRFNHIVAVDVMYINSRPVLHLVDEATHCNAAQFLRNMSSQHVWKTILKCWSRVYLGPPVFLHVDQGSNFVSAELEASAEADGVTVLQAPIESPSTMSHVERYHAPLRVAYSKIRDSLPRSETNEECLQMAVKSINDTIGREGLCPTLLVFGTLPRPAKEGCSETQLQRARAMDVATKAVQKEQAARRLAFGLKHDHGPKRIEASEELRKLPAGTPVYVYRDHSEKWEGPLPFIQIEGETVVVQLPRGRKIFRSTVVKPTIRSELRECSSGSNLPPILRMKMGALQLEKSCVLQCLDLRRS